LWWLLPDDEERWRKDQKLFLRGLSAVIAGAAGGSGSSGRGATDLLLLSPVPPPAFCAAGITLRDDAAEEG
jgi:hypothetical protein